MKQNYYYLTVLDEFIEA